jgi:hypothetical protein
MGREWWRAFVSGIAIAAAAYAPAPPPTTGGPLSCWVTFAPNGDEVFTVAGASGNLSIQGYGIVQSEYSGGTPPFVESLAIESDPSGKLSFVPNGLGADTIGYSGFSLNEVEGGWIKYTVRDGTGTIATARFPATGSISVTRTS